MKYYCLQLSDYDCGFACLKMLLSFKLKDKEYLHLKQDIYKGEYSFLDLTLIAQKNHIILEGYIILNYKDIFSLPCIGIIKKEKYNHYILITKISKKYVTYFDPKIGEIVIDKNNFNLLITGNYLFFKGTDNSFK